MASGITPSRSRQIVRSDSSSPKGQMVLRSGRKTMMPPEYLRDLDNKVLLRSARKKIVLQDDIYDINNSGCSTHLKSSKTGRFSARRKLRKTKSHFEAQNVNLDTDIMEALVNVVEENKENVEPEKFSKIEKMRLEQRKSFESAILRQQNRNTDVKRLNCSDSVIPRLKAKGSPYVKKAGVDILSVLRSRECDKISTENDNASEQMTTEENSNDVESIKKVSTRTVDDDNISDFGLRHLDDSSDSVLLCEQNVSLIVVDEQKPTNGLNSSDFVCISDEENSPKIDGHETSESDEIACINCEEEEEAKKSHNVSLNSTKEIIEPRQILMPLDVTTDSHQSAICSSNVVVNEKHIFQRKSIVTNMSAKAFIPHRIRKRSSSQAEKKIHHVTFQNPALETIIFNVDNCVDSMKDTSSIIDQSHAQSISEGTEGPRKRFCSLEETNAHHPLKTDPVEQHPWKYSTPKRVLLRKKMPNFNEIHQRRFEKMENLGEHLERKAERAKHLTNSVTKLRQAHTLLMSKEKKKKANEEEEGTKKKKIEDNSKFKPKNILKMAGGSIWNTTNPSTSTIWKTPVAIVKAMPIKISKAKEVKQVGNESGDNSFALGASRSQDKVHKRREQHMKMFKMGAGDRSERHTTEFVRGIRSNRRFELQMQYRQNRLQQDKM